MSSYRQILYHIIFRTKNGKKSLTVTQRKELFAYIACIINRKNCFVYRINGTDDHIHILSDLHPSVALADYVRDIKTSTSIWLKQHRGFPLFTGWADGYAAMTCSFSDKISIINYIKNQQEHHRQVIFEDELRRLLEEQGFEIDERYFP